MEFDISKTVQKIVMQAKETQEDFIIETIYPYCEDILQMKINKEGLKQILIKGMQKSQPCEDCVSREDVEKNTWEEPQQRWIPINDETDLPQDKHLWVTHRNASGYCYVDELSWDMTEWSDCTDDVVAYMEYNMPEPYEEE